MKVLGALDSHPFFLMGSPVLKSDLIYIPPVVISLAINVIQKYLESKV